MTSAMEMRTSSLVLPSSGYELDREEMSYVEGGFNWIQDGFYMNNQDLLLAIGATAANWMYISAALAATKLVVSTSWLNAVVGIGTAIWTILGISSVILGIYIISALSQNKGLEFKLTYTWMLFFNCPTGISLEVK